MNENEADRIIAELAICFPAKTLSVEEVNRWNENLLRFNYEDARATVKRIEETCKFWPTWAEFLEAVAPMMREREYQKRLEQTSSRLAIEAPEQTEEDYARTKELIKQLRSKFTSIEH